MSDSAHAQSTPALSPLPFNWSGFYLGLHGGAILRDDEEDDFGECGPFSNLHGEDGDFLADSVEDIGCFPGFPVDGPNAFEGTFPTFDLDDDYVAWTGGKRSGRDWSFLAGGQVGVRQQYGPLVFGLEGDISRVFNGSKKEEITFDYFHSILAPPSPFLDNYEGTGTVTVKSSLDWFSTALGSVGTTLGNEGRLLVYGTGGLALAGVDHSISGEFDDFGKGVDFCQDGCFFGDADDGLDIQVGYAVGGGAEYAFTNNLSLGMRYLFAHFDDPGSSSITFFADDGRRFDIERKGGIENVHMLTARLNFLFGPGSLP